MSLGFARDSVHDLSSLVGADKSLTKKKTTSIEGESSEVSLPGSELESKVTRFDLDPKETQDGRSTTNADTTSPASGSTPTSSYGHYSGFASDYADYEQYGVTFDQYSQSSLVLGQKKTSQGGFLCCFFPWNVNKATSEGTDEEEDDDPVSSNEVESARSEDDASTASATYYGEKLPDNERAAILGRLRLVGPDSTTIGRQDVAHPSSLEATPATSKKGPLVNGLANYEGSDQTPVKKMKSILRKGSMAVTPSTVNPTNSAKATQAENGRRRSLFPQQYEQTPKNDKNIRFAPMARVVAIKSKNEMSDLERSLIWWQKQDYEDFKKTGRMIAKAMCEGGSEIWLASNNAWQSKAARIGAASPRAHHLSERSAITKADDGKSGASNGDKWWHHFGHSRRGLEHIASVEEGRQRQANVRIAIAVVIDEQRRQKSYRKEDPEKLRMLSLQYTTWARELALAAAASDAEAVQVDFDENRKSREFYILKQAKSQAGLPKTLPSFMMPVAVSPHVLDHHTSTQIRFRRKHARVGPSPLPKSDGTGPNSGTSEPIHDASSSTTKLAKQAAGFGATDADVSAILSGLGSVDENSMPAMKPQMASVGAH